jgi:hypothetical protein
LPLALAVAVHLQRRRLLAFQTLAGPFVKMKMVAPPTAWVSGYVMSTASQQAASDIDFDVMKVSG